MRTALLAVTVPLFALALMLACAGEAAPGPEWQRARAAYDVAMAENGVGYLGPRWDETLALLRAVPAAPAADHRRARALIDEIERTRAAATAQLQKGAADAEKLLDIPVSAPLEIGPPASQAPNPASTTALPAPPVGITCRNSCTSGMLSCLDAAGCKREGESIQCEGNDVSRKATECRTTQLACEKSCPPIQ